MTCNEPTPSANNKPCGRQGMKQWDNYAGDWFWMCPTHGLILPQDPEEK